jgi:GDP-L-fucose synthase
MDIEGAKVVVTGGSGFLGGHLTNELRAHGAKVAAVSRADYDLRHRADIDRMLRDVRPDTVVHLAAVVGGIGANRAQPGRFFYDNAVMGIELLDACRVSLVPKVVIAGTVCAYPKVTPLPFREVDLWAGYPEETNAPYGLAKKMLLVQAQAYREQYGTNIIYLLPVNLYGPGDNFDLETGHVIPAMIRKFIEARDERYSEVRHWGDGSPTREFLHVRDAARAFRLALERYDGGEPVNVGSGIETSIREIADLVAELIGFTGKITWDTTKPNGQPRRAVDVDSARGSFGFEATIGLEEGLDETVRWYESLRAYQR